MNVARPLAPTDWEEPSTLTVYPPGAFEPDVVTVTAMVPTSGRPSSARGLGLWESLQAPAITRTAAAVAMELHRVLRAIVHPPPERWCRSAPFGHGEGKNRTDPSYA